MVHLFRPFILEYCGYTIILAVHKHMHGKAFYIFKTGSHCFWIVRLEGANSRPSIHWEQIPRKGQRRDLTRP
jgi:hypothetical protein